MTKNSADILDNKLLTALPEVEYQRLFPHLQPVDLTLGQVIYEPDSFIEWVYFPENSMISIVSTLSDNSVTEIGLIGNDGMVGLPVILGGQYMRNQAIVQVAGSAVKLSAEVLKQAFQQREAFQRILLLHTEARLYHLSQLAVCRSHHDIEKRFCRWLLFTHNCVKNDTLFLTQQFIAQMLGVRRASVTEVAQNLQKLGIIDYKRGCIKILNRPALEATVCECYHLIMQETNRLLDKSSCQD